MPDVAVSYDVLASLDGSLKQIIVEFERAAERVDLIEEAIGAPFGLSLLRDRVAQFEAGWDVRRGRLTDDLLRIQERVEETARTWAKWDLDASRGSGSEGGAAGPTSGAR